MTAVALKPRPALAAPQTRAPRTGLRRRSLSQRLELAAVLSLMGSGAACALFTLCHLV